MTHTDTPVAATPPSLARRAGLWCLAAVAVSLVQVACLLAWSPQVPDDRYSYPFTAGGYALAQLTFFVQHIPLVLALVAVASIPAVRSSRTALIAMWAAVIGMTGLTAMELAAITAKDALMESARADLINGLYAPPVLLAGAGLTVAGVVLIRRSLGRLAWYVFATGAWVFVAVTPALASGAFIAGRLAIGGWMLLFGLIGLALITQSRNLQPEPST